MRTFTRIAGAAGAAALGVMTVAPTAFADGAGNDGANLINDNNVNAVPIQLCQNDVPVLIGVVVPIASPEKSNCVNAPLADHPESEKSVSAEH